MLSFLPFVAALALSAASQEPPKEAPQFVPGVYLNQAVKHAVARAKTVGPDFKLAESGASLVGAYLEPGKHYQYRIDLEKGEQYALVGAGDDDVKELEVYVSRDDVRVASSTGEKAHVVFEAAKTGEYLFRITLKEGVAASFVAMIHLQESKEGVPASAALDAMASIELETSSPTFQNLGGTRLHDEANNLCLFGGVIDPDRQIGISNLELEPERQHIFMGGGQKDLENIDLYIRHKDDVVASDEELDRFPIVLLEEPQTERLDIDIANRSKKKGFAAVLIVDVERAEEA